MSTNVRQIILDALPHEARSGQYSRYVDAAVTAVQRRDEEVAESIRDAARSAGVNSSQVEAALRDAGLVAEPQAVSSGSDGDGDLAAQVRDIAQNVDRLMGVARSRGLL